MKETPIIMSGNHPKLILDGIKTQTRRVIKPQPNGDLVFREVRGRPQLNYWYYQDATGMHCYDCPYGQVGDRLWVRETFGDIIFRVSDSTSADFIYKSDWDKPLPHNGKWTPSIFMPRWASRITLEITELRAERLQEITEEDAKAEGCMAQPREIWWQGYRELDMGELGIELMHQQTIGENAPDWMLEPHRMLDRPDLEAMFSARNRFSSLWDSLNAKRGYGWDKNNWVWVIGFKRLEL